MTSIHESFETQWSALFSIKSEPQAPGRIVDDLNPKIRKISLCHRAGAERRETHWSNRLVIRSAAKMRKCFRFCASAGNGVRETRHHLCLVWKTMNANPTG